MIMKKFSILFLLLTLSYSQADSLGVNKTINDYIDNGYQLESINVLGDDRLLYNLIIKETDQNIFEPKLITCIFDINTQIAECFKP